TNSSFIDTSIKQKMNNLVLAALLVVFFGIVPVRANILQSQDVLKVFREAQRMGLKLDTKVGQTVDMIIKPELQQTLQGYHEVMDELTHKMKKISNDYHKVVAGVSFRDSNCWCVNYTCGCCYNLVVEQISLNDTGCLNITYLVDEYGFEFTFTLNGKVVIDRKISVKNPPPICAAIPYVHNLASLCLRFYNLDYVDQHFSGCASIEAELEGVVVKTIELGCFRIPPTFNNSLAHINH
ncbi:hypothetical protein BgiMline_033715, partial [Biomphalaria glabrata]